MWIVINYKKKEIENLKKEIAQKIGSNVQFYNPKINYLKKINHKIQKYQKNILDNYIFCFNHKFKEKVFKNKLNFCRGLNYILPDCLKDQKDISTFIDMCKSFEEKDGSLKNNFFLNLQIKKGKFINGPFKNLIFYFLNKENKKSKIQLGNKVITINKETNLLFSLA